MMRLPGSLALAVTMLAGCGASTDRAPKDPVPASVPKQPKPAPDPTDNGAHAGNGSLPPKKNGGDTSLALPSHCGNHPESAGGPHYAHDASERERLRKEHGCSDWKPIR